MEQNTCEKKVGESDRGAMGVKESMERKNGKGT